MRTCSYTTSASVNLPLLPRMPAFRERARILGTDPQALVQHLIGLRVVTTVCKHTRLLVQGVGAAGVEADGRAAGCQRLVEVALLNAIAGQFDQVAYRGGLVSQLVVEAHDLLIGTDVDAP